ncbi:MAG TPA: hypothetical protein VJN89_16975 [Candidatus Acidoferrum sp.]|nr:hypothetical protein [Candidatus Acidoferrum sp.]
MRLRSCATLFILSGTAAWISLASAPKATQEASKNAKAIVFVGRLKDFGTRNWRPSIFIDEHEIARAENGRFLIARVDPGKHAFRAEDPQFAVQMELKEGQCYFFRVEIASGAWKAHGRLVSVTREQGVEDRKRLEPIDESHVKDKEMVDTKQATALADGCVAQQP